LPTKDVAESLPVDRVTAILENYATRGVFRAFSQAQIRGQRAAFKMTWHHDRLFELAMDMARHTLRFPVLLPGVAPESSMYRELKEFVDSRHSPELPPHRAINPEKARARCGNRSGNVSVTVQVRDGDYEYATRKLIHLVDEIFKNFLCDGPYYDYLVEHLGLDPDRY
jgi:hypothetical protein